MNLRRGGSLIAVLSGMLSTGSCAAPPSLCHGDENIVFTCKTRKGVASICLTPGASRSLHYRFGDGARIDFVYPEGDTSAGEAFSADTLMFSGGGGAYIQFHKAGYRYTVFTAIGRWGDNGRPRDIAGVAVSKGDREVANLACDGATVSELGSELFQSLKLKTVEDGFDIPEAFTK